MTTGYVYILQSQNSLRYYIGSTNDPVRRLSEHNANEVAATRGKGPWTIGYAQAYPSSALARQIEHRLKSLKSRKILDRILADQHIALI